MNAKFADRLFLRLWLLLCLAGSLLSGCFTKPEHSNIRLNQIQVIGTHNSYHLRAPEALRTLLAKHSPDEANGLDYQHPPLDAQLSSGIRQLELDCFADPEGGRFANPRGVQWAVEARLPAVPRHDPNGRLLKPGFKVMHVQDIDYFSSVLTLIDGLQEIRRWSLKHPRHVPIFILLELKEDAPGKEFTPAMSFGEKELAALESEILSVFPKNEILKPDDVRGTENSLPEALRKHGWPALDSVRGKVMFGMDNVGTVRDLYLKSHPALEGRLLFVSVSPSNPAAAWMKENDPVEAFDRIQQLVRAGFLVRTRADSDTSEARNNDVRRRDKAIASGAQFISTDYPKPNLAFSTYSVRFERKVTAQPNLVNSGNTLKGIDLDR